VPELLRLPEVATGDDGATLTAWLLDEGAEFADADALATVETAKAVVDIEAPAAGRLLRLLVPAGAEVAVGDPIAVLCGAGEVVADVPAAMAALGVRADVAAPVVRTSAPEPAPVAATTGPQRLFASPLARRLAREGGLVLETITATGPRGRIVRVDVERALAATAPTAPAPAAPAAGPPVPPVPTVPPVPVGPGPSVEPHSRMRRTIARRLTESKATVPHFYVRASARVDGLMALRTQLAEQAGVTVSLNDLVLKAMAVAYLEVPDANACWDDAGMRRPAEVDLGVAVAVEGGLVTPVLRDVGSRSVAEVAAGTRELVLRARSGRLQQDELEGGTASVSNLGMFGTEEFTAIINPPQSAILAVGAARPEPVVVAGELAVATVLRMTLSVDHRAVDGALAATWTQALVGALESPLRLVV
jgi:pyruvate dehydrogenase E2 component (dihydrolipoamide acetyltransferase)